MITVDMYKDFLLKEGRNTAEVKKNRADLITNVSFTTDTSYKKVYILSKDGWKFEDAKYTTHSKPSILKDAVDYYLQFRPKTHYPIGTYVFVPDDREFDINLSENELKNPFDLSERRMTQLWMIVGRTKDRQFVKYNILQCNWNFKWIYDGEVQNCWGCVRNANSYTSGVFIDNMSANLDNLSSAWLPDIHYVYGDKLSDLCLCDTRTIFYRQRFMITSNKIQPKIYQVTKVLELVPPGLIKYTLKQDELNTWNDNVDLMICDYYKDTGDESVINTENNHVSSNNKISQMFINENGELDYLDNNSDLYLYKGMSSYFEFIPKIPNSEVKWDISLIDNGKNYSDKDHKYYVGLMKLTKFSDESISVKPGKANSLIGKKFLLTATDCSHDEYSSIELEVKDSEVIV